MGKVRFTPEFAFFTLLCLVPAFSDAKFIVEEHSLTISATSVKGTFNSAIANFGIPQYGGTMAGTVVYSSGDKAQACSRALAGMSFKAAPGELPKILLVDRGGCYFTEKVWNAQLAGASAVLVADDKDENLITMDAPEDDPETNMYITNITIPSALIRKNTSDAIKLALSRNELVNVNMDWSEALPHPDERVEYEFWTNSNDECGSKCDVQATFVEEFKGIAQTMEKGGYVQFTPHYITWYCPKTYVDSKQCKSQCINNGRYCAPDPEQDFDVGYDGKDVVVENLRELCVFTIAKEAGRPWVWWDYVTDFKLRCQMKDKMYNKECAEKVISSLGMDLRRVADCVGDPTRDYENPVLKSEQAAQVGDAQRSDVTILPTLVINQRQYRGKLDSKAVVRAICSGFKEGTEPPQCLGKEIQTNECLNGNNGGCWKEGNFTACKDTFRGRLCECPKDESTGTLFVGDGYTNCKAAGPGRCQVNNGDCWSNTKNGITFTACQDNIAGTGCQCPAGFSGDGYSCEDIDECAASNQICSCPQCRCKNTYGSYECSCRGNGVYIREHDTCVGKAGSSSSSGIGWMAITVVIGCILAVSVGGYIIYKYRIRSYMDSEIRAIMAQYMPLDSQNEAQDRGAPRDVA